MALFAAAILARAAPPPSLQADLQAVVNAQAVQWNTSFSLGLSWGDGSEVLAVAAGADNHAAGTTVNTSTLYPLGSATKMYTAVACLQLAEQKKLDLDAPLAALVDPFLQRTNKTSLLALYGDPRILNITTRQVLSMRSGVPDYDDQKVKAWSFDRANAGKDLSPYDYLHAADLTPKKFLFEPGTEGSYSSIGFELAGLVLAAATSSATWKDYDQRSILPAALAATLPDFTFPLGGPCSSLPRVVEQYAIIVDPAAQESADWVTLTSSDLTWGSCLNGWTFGNLAAAAADVARVVHATFSKGAATRLLSDASLAQMLTFQPLTVGWSTGLPYGMGTMHVQIFASDTIPSELLTFVGHAGQDYGSGAALHYYNAALDVSVVMATSSAPGLNCSLADVTQNGQGPSVAACLAWEAVLVSYGKAKTGELSCDHRRHRLADDAAAADAPAPPTTTPGMRGVHLARPSASPLAAARVGGAANGRGNGPMHCATGGPKVCVGASAALGGGECAAWKAFHARAGGVSWGACAASFADPCGCDAVTCSSDGAHITAIDLSGAGLLGPLPAELAALTQLQRLNVSHNRLFGDAPALPYSSYAAGGCDLTDNLLSCPLPAGADGCHPPGAAPPTCAPTSPQVSPLCGLALGQLYGNPAVVNATAAFYAALAGVYQDLGNVCGTELQVNGTCHFPLDWNATKGGRTLLAYLRGAIHAANPKGGALPDRQRHAHELWHPRPVRDLDHPVRPRADAARVHRRRPPGLPQLQHQPGPMRQIRGYVVRSKVEQRDARLRGAARGRGRRVSLYV